MSGDFVLLIDKDGNQAFVVLDGRRDWIDIACLKATMLSIRWSSVGRDHDSVSYIRRFVRQRWRYDFSSEETIEWRVFVEDDRRISEIEATAWSIDAWRNRTGGIDYLTGKWRKHALSSPDANPPPHNPRSRLRQQR